MAVCPHCGGRGEVPEPDGQLALPGTPRPPVKQVTARDIVKTWFDRHPGLKLPSTVTGHMSSQSKRLLADGFTPREVWQAIERWASKSYRGSLASYAVEQVNGHPSTTDSRVAEALSLAEKYRKEGL